MDKNDREEYVAAIDYLKARTRELEVELARYQKALDGLTIAGGGSEMHGAPEKQAGWIREQMNVHGARLKEVVIQRKDAEAREKELREALGAADNKILNFLATLSFVEPSNKVFTDDLTEARALIEAAKGV